jgi:hypothetical protein
VVKTIRLKTGGVERLSDEAAELLVSRNQATYCPKSEWKAGAGVRFQERALELLRGVDAPSRPNRRGRYA